MSITYTPTTNFGAKDSLPANDPAKVIKGAEFTTEYTAIQSAFALAAPASNPTFTGTASFADVSITNDLTVDTNTLVVDSTNNRVGIGTASPSAKLDVFAGADERLKITTIGSNLGFVSTNAADSAYQPVEFQASSFAFTQGNVGIGTSSPGVPLEIESPSGASQLSTVRLRATNTSGANTPVVDLSAGFASGGTTNDSYFSISTRNVSGVGERVRIDANGNVGIGTDSPEASQKLHLANTSGNCEMTLQSSDSGVASLLFGDATDFSRGKVTYDNSSESLAFQVNNLQEAMRIDSSGNVGIGTTSDSHKLEVRGSDQTARLRGASIQYLDIEANTGGTVELDANNGDLAFAVNNTERMRIDPSGNVGIGTDSPSSLLYTRGDGSYDSTQGIRIQGGPSANVHGIYGTLTDLVFAPVLTEAMRLDSSGNLLVGATSTTGPTTAKGVKLYPDGRGFFISDAAAATGLFARSTNGRSLQFYVSGVDAGGINITSGGTPALSAASDERLKDNIVDHESELANVMALRPARWDWKDEARGSGEGFIAQELEQTAWADLVSEGDNGYKQVAGLGAVETRLIKALQEQQEMIESLKAKVEALENA